MTPYLDTLLIALYVEIDDHETGSRQHRPGQPKRQLVNGTLKGQLDLERHGGHTTERGLRPHRQRLLATAVCIWHNWATGPVKRSPTAFDN